MSRKFAVICQIAHPQASRRVLVVGGSGYLGQFVVEHFATTDEVAFTHHSSIAPATFPVGVCAFWVDLVSGEGLQEAFSQFGPVDAVVNCAAISAPAACEKDAATARAVNIPTHLLDCLEWHKSQWKSEPRLLHISTDQVYDGSKALWSEDDTCQPVNVYGRSKRDAETAIQERWPNHVILRSSIIYGPQCSTPVSRMLFLQFIVSSLEGRKATSFFDDEFRSPIYVQDILRVLGALVGMQQLDQHLLNMGGPERLSRLDMALQVADVYDLDKSCINAVPSATVNRGVASPADISMSVERIQAFLPDVQLTNFAKALRIMKDDVLNLPH